MTNRDIANGFYYCMHGLGAYAGLRQTNALEALEYWYGKGVRIFEMDFAQTSDNQFVAIAHSVDKKSLMRLDIVEIPHSYTYKWFMSQRLFPVTTKGLTPISLQMIPDLLMKYPDMIIMMDMFGLFKFEDANLFCSSLVRIIGQRLELKDRILVEVYNNSMSLAVKTCGLEGIYGARHEHDSMVIDIPTRINELRDLGISYISYPFKYSRAFPDEIQQYVQAGFIVFSRTLYNTKVKLLKSLGVHVNIVDYKFDGLYSPFQACSYFIACLKRLIAKIIIQNKAKRL